MSLFPPKNANIRLPKDTSQKNGLIWNPARVQEESGAEAVTGIGGGRRILKGMGRFLHGVEKPERGAAPKGRGHE